MNGINNPFSRNDYGHPRLSWRLFVKSSEEWRKRYKRFNIYRNQELLSKRKSLVENIKKKKLVNVKEEKGFKKNDISNLRWAGEAIGQALSIIKSSSIKDHVVGQRRMTSGYINKDTLDVNDPIVSLALNESIISSATNYLGCVPVIGNIDIMVSRKREKESSGEPKESELFHCDWDDTRILRLFIHCNDVEEESGPLNVMPAKESSFLREEINYNWGGFFKNSGYRVTDDVAYRHVDPNIVESMTGPKGTTCFVDTCRCFHYGSRVEDERKMRKILLIEYVTPFCFKFPPSGYIGSAPFRHLDSSELSILEKLVIGAK